MRCGSQICGCGAADPGSRIPALPQLEPMVLGKVQRPVASRGHAAHARAERSHLGHRRGGARDQLELRVAPAIVAPQHDGPLLCRAEGRAREAMGPGAWDGSPVDRRRRALSEEDDLRVTTQEIDPVRQKVFAVAFVQLRQRKALGDAPEQGVLPLGRGPQRISHALDEAAVWHGRGSTLGSAMGE